MSQKVYEAVATGLRNTINTSVANPRQQRMRTHIGRRVGAGPATVARRGNGRFRHLGDKLVIFGYLCWKNTNGNLDIFFRERGWVLDVWVERRCSGYNLIKSNYYNHDLESEWRTNGRTSEQSMSSETFCPRSWSLVMAALKELVARAWLSIYSNLYIKFNVLIE